MPNLTVTQAAALIGAHSATVRRWCEKGTLPAEKVGWSWIIDQADLDAFTPPKRGRPPNSKSAAESGKE